MSFDKRDVEGLTTLFDVLCEVWRARVYLAVSCAISVILAYGFIALATPYYRADMIVGPASHMGQSTSAAAMIGEGSARVQQEDLQSTAAFLRFEAIYDGVSVASILVKDKDIITALLFDLPFEFSDVKTQWSAETFSEYLHKRVRLEPVAGTSLRRLTYYHPNKKFAVYLVRRVHSITDEIIRARILVETNERMRYLDNALNTINNPEHKRNLVSLLMEQERLRMMVSLDQPYAASVIEPPFVSSRPKWPDSYVIYPVFIFAGLLLGFAGYGAFRRV